MNLPSRISKLEEVAPARRRSSVPIPTTVSEFARGFLRGEFCWDDVDRSNPDETTPMYEFGVALVVLGSAHQRWCDESGWGRPQQDQWERTTLLLEPGEMQQLRALAAALYPDDKSPAPAPSGEPG
jgi:hypothetical protein